MEDKNLETARDAWDRGVKLRGGWRKDNGETLRDCITKEVADLLNTAIAQARLAEAEWWAENAEEHTGAWTSAGQCRCMFCKRLESLRAASEVKR